MVGPYVSLSLSLFFYTKYIFDLVYKYKSTCRTNTFKITIIRNESNVNKFNVNISIIDISRAFGAPAKDGDSFVLDMATSTVALGKVEISQRRGAEIPNTWGVNEKG